MYIVREDLLLREYVSRGPAVASYLQAAPHASHLDLSVDIFFHGRLLLRFNPTHI